jgi:NADH-quinone oxidoreductase subunit G
MFLVRTITVRPNTQQAMAESLAGLAGLNGKQYLVAPKVGIFLGNMAPRSTALVECIVAMEANWRHFV